MEIVLRGSKTIRDRSNCPHTREDCPACEAAVVQSIDDRPHAYGDYSQGWATFLIYEKDRLHKRGGCPDAGFAGIMSIKCPHACGDCPVVL